jgi:hypothetical protein
MTRTRMVLIGSLLAFSSSAAVTSSASADSCMSACGQRYATHGAYEAASACVANCRRESFRQQFQDPYKSLKFDNPREDWLRQKPGAYPGSR